MSNLVNAFRDMTVDDPAHPIPYGDPATQKGTVVYVVFRGRRTGLFYSWCVITTSFVLTLIVCRDDVDDATNGYSGASCKSYRHLKYAQRAWYTRSQGTRDAQAETQAAQAQAVPVPVPTTVSQIEAPRTHSEVPRTRSEQEHTTTSRSVHRTHSGRTSHRDRDHDRTHRHTRRPSVNQSHTSPTPAATRSTSGASIDTRSQSSTTPAVRPMRRPSPSLVSLSSISGDSSDGENPSEPRYSSASEMSLSLAESSTYPGIPTCLHAAYEGASRTKLTWVVIRGRRPGVYAEA